MYLLLLCREYFNAPLPDYLYEKYLQNHEPRAKNQDGKNEDYVRFENFLAGTGNEFIGRGAPTSGTATHLLHLKALRNPVDFMRYVKGVVFPGKEFMIEKYNINGKWLMINGKFWWLWYPYRWAIGLRGLLRMINGK